MLLGGDFILSIFYILILMIFLNVCLKVLVERERGLMVEICCLLLVVVLILFYECFKFLVLSEVVNLEFLDILEKVLIVF